MRDEIGKGLRILVDAVESFLAVLAAEAAEAGSGRVHKDEIAYVEQAEVVIDDGIRRGRSVGIIGGDNTLRPKRTHVKPHAGGAGTSVVEEGERTRRAFGIGFEIGDVEHAGFRGLVLGIGVGILRDIVPALGMDDKRTRKCVVIDDVSAYGNRSFAGLLLWLELFGFWRFRFGGFDFDG